MIINLLTGLTKSELQEIRDLAWSKVKSNGGSLIVQGTVGGKSFTREMKMTWLELLYFANQELRRVDGSSFRKSTVRFV